MYGKKKLCPISAYAEINEKKNMPDFSICRNERQNNDAQFPQLQ